MSWDTDVKSSSEGTCYCGMHPREEYGAHCPSCAYVAREEPRQYWLGVKETEWLRQHVPVAQWPQGFLEYWLGLRIEGNQPYGEQLYAPDGSWGTGEPPRSELEQAKDREDAEWARLEGLGVPPDVIGEAMADPRYRYVTLSSSVATGPHPDGDPASPATVPEAMAADEVSAIVDWARLHRPDLSEGEVVVLWRAAERADAEYARLDDAMSRVWESEADLLSRTPLEIELVRAALEVLTGIVRRVAGITR